MSHSKEGGDRLNPTISFDIKKLQSEEMVSSYVGTLEEEILQTTNGYQNADSVDVKWN